MKTKTTLFFSILFISLTSFTNSIQDTQYVSGAFDGHEDYGYNFIVINDEEEERTMTFHEVETEVLNSYDLDSEDLIGTTFKITYTIDKETVLDENGDEEENETLTIVDLKAME